ncbi:hypothetical protein DJ528_07315, partial [Sulfolobus sp. B5]
YTGDLIILPILVTSSYQPYINSNGITSTSPNQVGYINVEGNVKPISIQGQLINLLSQSGGVEINSQAYLIQNGETVNITYVTNSSYIPALWVLTNISGELFRIAFTYFAPTTYLNTPSNGVIQTYTTLVQEFQQIFQNVPLANFVGGQNTPGSLSIQPGVTYDVYNGQGPIGFVSLYVPPTPALESNVEIAPNVNLEGSAIYYDNVFFTTTPNIPIYEQQINYVPISYFIDQINPNGIVQSYEQTVNQMFSGLSFTTISTPVTISGTQTYNGPIEFTGPVTFGSNVQVTFNGPVIFKGTVNFQGSGDKITFNGPVVFEGTTTLPPSSSFYFADGLLSNGTGSCVIINNHDYLNVQGPVLFDDPSGAIRISSYINIQTNSIVYFNALTVIIGPGVNIQDQGPLIACTTELTFSPNGNLNVNGPFLLNGKNGGLTISSNAVINVNSVAYISSNYALSISPNSVISSVGYLIFNFGKSGTVNPYTQLIVNQGNPNNYPVSPPLINPQPGETYYVTFSTWFSIIPNNQNEVVANVTLEADNSPSPIVFSLSPVSPTSYELGITSGSGQTQTIPYELYLNSYYFLSLELKIVDTNNVLSVCPSYVIMNSSWQYSGSSPEFTVKPAGLYLTAELGNESFYQLMLTNGTEIPANLLNVISSSPIVNYANYIQSQGLNPNTVGVAYFYLITPSNLISELTPTYTNIEEFPVTLYVEGYTWSGA